MKQVFLRPTHIILTTTPMISAWNGFPASMIEPKFVEGDGKAFSIFVALIDAEYAAEMFTTLNLRMMEGKQSDENWVITRESVLQMYGNATSVFHRPWLPDDALIGIVARDDLKPLIEFEEWNRPLEGLNQKTIEHLVDDFCSCDVLDYAGGKYYYGMNECGVHGPYDESKPESCIVARQLTLRIAGEFTYAKSIEPLAELQYMNVYGYGEYITGEVGVYASTPDDKFGHAYYFIPQSRFTEEMWNDIVSEYPEISINK